MVKRIVSVILLASMVFCLFGCKKTEETPTPTGLENTGDRLIGGCCGERAIGSTDLDECITTINTVRERGLINEWFFGLDYDGDAFDIVYILSSIGGDGGDTLTEFISHDCIQSVGATTLILLNDYTGCNCGDGDYLRENGHEGYGWIYQEFFGLTGIEPSVPVIRIEAEDHALTTENFDSSLLTYEQIGGEYPEDYMPVYYSYYIKYDGTVIARTRSCLPIDEQIWDMIVSSIVVA